MQNNRKAIYIQLASKKVKREATALHRLDRTMRKYCAFPAKRQAV